MGCLLKANGLYSRTTIGAVLLAAGAGSRLGHRPKALLELGGVPLIVRQCVALSGAGVDELVVVLGHHADAIEPAVAPFPITIVRNPECVSPRPPSTATAPRGGSNCVWGGPAHSGSPGSHEKARWSTSASTNSC